jgi:hypothetical protein
LTRVKVLFHFDRRIDSSDVVAELPTFDASRAAPVSLFVGALVVDVNLKAKQDGKSLRLSPTTIAFDKQA